MLTDEELVCLYREGNNEAFDFLLDHNKGRLFQYICFMVGGNEDVANDVFQDTFVKAIMAIRDGRYQEEGQFGAWLTRIARNIILDTARTRRSCKMVNKEITSKDGEVTGDVINNYTVCESNAETLVMLEQSRIDVRTMVDRLPDAQREVVVLRFFQELSFKEIADITNVSINTALGRMHYAMINLRRMAEKRDLYLAI